MRSTLHLASLATALFACPLHAQEAAPNGSSPEQQAAIADDPAFVSQRLVLADLPQATGPRVNLFNGRNLAGWDAWIGFADPLSTYGNPQGEPIGTGFDPAANFSVVIADGTPALYARGELFGSLATSRAYGNYHLRLEYRWGARRWLPIPRNNGILYHSHGRPGAFFDTWMTAVEFEIVPHSVGMILGVGDSRGTHSFLTVDWRVSANVEVGQDQTIPYPGRRFMPGGRKVPITFPAFNVEAAIDAENPIGEWNTLDLYVYGDGSVHVVNGVPVMVASGLATTDEETGERVPLVAGKIQLQSEGAETFFRNITIEPIDHLPRVVAVQ